MITTDKVYALQYEILNNNVQNIISNSESDYKTISALGMENVEFYKDATKKGIIQNIDKNLIPGTSVAIFDTKLNEIVYLVGNEELGRLIAIEYSQNIDSHENKHYKHDFLLSSGESVSTLLAFGEYSNWDWKIVSFVNKDQLLKYSNDAIKLSIIMAAIFLFFIFIIVFKLSNRISRTIVALEEGAHQLLNNNEDVKIKLSGNDEFASLATNFNLMAAEIRNKETSLRQSISDEKIANISLLDSRKQYHDLIEEMPDIITRVDLDGYLLFVNKAASVMFGLSAEDCIGKLAFNFIHPDDLVGTKQKFASWLESNTLVFIHENRQINADGQIINVAWSIRGEFDEYDTLIGFASTGRDITKYKRNLEEKEKLENQLVQAQKMEAVGQLAGGIAHDFNNMLGVILGHAELALAKSDTSSPLIVNLKGIITAGRHSAELTKQLLTYARKQIVEPKIINLNESISRMLTMLQRLTDENIELSFEQGANLASIKIDPSQVDQILANLCVNASDAIESFGTIVIKTENYRSNGDSISNKSSFEPLILPAGNYVKLSISDSGSGMKKEVIKHVFEPFYTTKEVGKGTGLGLSTIFGAVKQNNGYIEVISALNQGTTFNIYFNEEKGNNIKPRADEAKPDRECTGNETVLIVEDDEMLLDIQIITLERYGYKVLSATNVNHAETVAKGSTGQIDLLLTDVIMPEMNGKELAEKLSLFHANMSVLFMSGYTADIIANKGIICNDINFIQKPFNSKVLASKVREVLDVRDQLG
jgi:PAS domain S-box-containing protein